MMDISDTKELLIEAEGKHEATTHLTQIDGHSSIKFKV